MSLQVNLVPARQSWYMKRQRLARYLRMVSFAAAGIYGAMMAGMLGWRVMVNQQLGQAKTRIDTVKQTIGELAQVESQQVLLKGKLGRLVQLEETKIDFAAVLTGLVNLFPTGVDLSEVKVGSTQSVEVTGKTIDPVALSQVLVAVADEEGGGGLFSEVGLEGVTKGSTGEYSFTLTLVPKTAAAGRKQ